LGIDVKKLSEQKVGDGDYTMQVILGFNKNSPRVNMTSITSLIVKHPISINVNIKKITHSKTNLKKTLQKSRGQDKTNVEGKTTAKIKSLATHS
jgi:hypothetical protein